jgi:hypothetical protein
VLVVDASGSAQRPAARQSAKDAFAEAIDESPAGSAIFGYALTDNTESGEVPPIQCELPAYAPGSETSDEFDMEVLPNARKSAQAYVDGLLSASDAAQGTDLFDGLRIAASVLNGPDTRDCPDRRLIIASDMIEQQPDCDFTSQNLTPARCRQIVAELRADHDIPDLTGVTVWVVCSTGQGVSAERIAAIRRFWTSYFLPAAGASASEDRYGPSLMNY